MKKNIVFIAIDDGFAYWRYRTAFGPRLQTPNLDRICDVSTAFHSAYCQVAVCGPSRASVMSGLSPYDTGVFDNYTNIFSVLRPEQMWAYRLKRDGFHCSTAGKIHHGYKPLEPEHHSVLYSEPARPIYFGPRDSVDHINFGGHADGWGTTDPEDDSKFYDHRSSEDAIAFFETYDGDKPFYREVGFHHPHTPFKTPVRFKEMYPEEDFAHPDDWELGFDVTEFTECYMSRNMDYENVAFWQKSVRNYFSAYSHVDHHIGRVWDAVKNSKHADNTIFVVYSDHGYHMGDKGRFKKFTLWEEAARAPLIIHDPSQQKQVVDRPVALIDIGPTILDYAGCEPMSGSLGRSLRPFVENEVVADKPVPTFWYGSASMRYENFRITLYQDGSSDFYDVEEDMWLTNNLAGKHPSYAAAKDVLLETCKSYGLLLVEQGIEVARASQYTSLIGDAQLPEGRASSGIISIGSVSVYCESPGYKKQFAVLANQEKLELGADIDELHYASGSSGGIENFVAHGNTKDNRFLFISEENRFRLEIHTGQGDNYIRTNRDTLHAYAGSGNDTILAGTANDLIYGGAGDDFIDGGGGNDIIHAGPGNDTLHAGSGNDTMYSGTGSSHMICGPGRNLVVVEGGINLINATQGFCVLRFLRTGLPQKVVGFAQGQLKIGDWKHSGPYVVKQVGDDTLLSNPTEQVKFVNTDVAVVKAALD